MNNQFTKYTVIAAYVAGIASIIGFIALILFFAIEAPQMTSSSDGFHFWGFISDVSGPATMIPLLVVILALHQAERVHAASLSRVTFVIGVIGALGVTILQLMLIFGLLTFEQEVGPVVLAMGILGIWLILVNYMGLLQGLFSRGLAWLGIAVGVTQGLYPVFLQALGGADFYGNLGSNILLMVLTGMIFLLSYVGFPIWMFWFARTWSTRRIKASAEVVYAG